MFYGYATNGQGNRIRSIIIAENSQEATTLFSAELIMQKNRENRDDWSAYKIEDIFEIDQSLTRCLILT